MRIVSGLHRGRVLVAPDTRKTRPTSDKARETLFNMLTHAPWAPDLEEARVLDLFAGSGALGLEALSRGARSVLLVDMAGAARQAIRQNIDTLGVASQARWHRRDATRLGTLPEEFQLIEADTRSVPLVPGHGRVHVPGPPLHAAGEVEEALEPHAREAGGGVGAADPVVADAHRLRLGVQLVVPGQAAEQAGQRVETGPGERVARAGIARRQAVEQVRSDLISALALVRAAALAERLFGDGQTLNTLMLGLAWQLGLLPVGQAALLRSIDQTVCPPCPASTRNRSLGLVLRSWSGSPNSSW